MYIKIHVKCELASFACIDTYILILCKKIFFGCKRHLLNKSQAVKNGAALCKMDSVKKVVKYSWRPRNAVMVARLVTKILATTI